MKIVIGMKNSSELAKNIAKKIKCSYVELETSNLSSGEVSIKFRKDIKNFDVILVKSFFPDPDTSIMELILTCNTAYELGAKSLTLVAPYIAYLHCDERDSSGSSLSNKIVSKLMSCADEIITVDPHLHRVDNLARLFRVKTKRVSANFAIASYIYKNFKNEVVIGPSLEDSPWSDILIKHVELKAIVKKKGKSPNKSVKIMVINGAEIKNKNVVILDDMIITGNTMIKIVKEVKKLKPRSISCVCVHGILEPKIVSKLKTAGASKIISTNTIPTKYSRIDVSDVISRALR